MTTLVQLRYPCDVIARNLPKMLEIRLVSEEKDGYLTLEVGFAVKIVHDGLGVF